MSTNDFKSKDKQLLQESWRCWICGKNTANAGHHIVGRGIKGVVTESSILNCAWLCNYTCHIMIHGQLRTDKWMNILLNQTKDFLNSIGYQMTDTDREFVEKYGKYYQ